jgi:predicted lipoprotein with Yx(FWY)xxD motif
MSTHRYRKIGMTLAALGVGATGIAAQSAAAATARPASAAVVKVESVKVSVGSSDKSHQILVASSGLPIYVLTGDSAKHPLCASSSCLGAWPAVTTTSKKPTLGKGVKGKVGVWHHGKVNQVTLNGHPLYTYADDSAGSALGEGLKSFHGVWEVLSPSGAGMTVAALKGSSASGSGGGGSSWS